MRRYGAYLFDLDGVIYRGTELLPGVPETIGELLRTARVAYLTNNSGYHREQVTERLRGHGLPVELRDVYSSGSVAARRLAEREVRTLYVVGEAGLERELREAGIEPRPQPPVDGVIVGRDTEFTFGKLMTAQQAILAGAAFYATNLDVTYPMEGGRLEPGSGALVAAVAAATEREPEVFGKPDPSMVRLALADMGVAAADALLVGDRLDTDILCAHNAGVDSALMLTGVTDSARAAAAPPKMLATYVLAAISELLG